jgi:putative DNA primase/helicase
MDAIDQFKQAIAAAGLIPPDEIIADGKIHRFSTNGKPRDDSGRYVLHLDGLPAGWIGDYRTGLSQTWCAKSDTAMTDAERDANQQRITAMKAQREAEQAQRQQSAATEATKRLAAAAQCTQHVYITRKGIKPHGVKIEGDNLLIPMRTTDSAVHSLQIITPDGSKLFMPGGRVKGCYFSIGKPAGSLIVCEGFATGASIHECTGHAVAVAFNAGNLEAVALALRAKYPDLKIIIAADDDHLTPGNPGLSKATAAAQAVGGFLAVPSFPADRPDKATDFNDLHQLAGAGRGAGVLLNRLHPCASPCIRRTGDGGCMA